ncbi:hypothetical protein RE628_03610 [Paenibacillus sp. D2_2]|uniref:hypothetical protein n=1 Tax=Paenibacillus sp. D2_2 TaxID=3073092 RepID=UPI00281499B9|nr:hypothetical protein [Paenibacillus sp. D2_2]WMT41617.1 hypothetical protein RE628_03610 [Paenibacillus sp. D2_2]
MPKIADKYLVVDPWKIVEEGFDPQRSRVSESIFSLGNEYMGVRGYAEEGYSGDTLIGSYFNGLFEESEVGRIIRGSFAHCALWSTELTGYIHALRSTMRLSI